MLIFCLIAGFLVAWIVLWFVVIRPKLAAYRYTSGIFAQLDVLEAGFWTKAGLWLKGLKVAIVGIVTSSAPVIVVFYDKIAGFDWTSILPTEKAKVVAVAVAVLGVFGPMLMVMLHQGALADASAMPPVNK